MGSLTDTMENDMLDYVFENSPSYTPQATVYLALFTADPTDTGSLVNEVPDSNNYTRKAITFGAAASRKVTQSGDVTFNKATGSWGTVSHWGVVDSATHGAGTMLAHGGLAVSKAVANGNTPKFSSGEVYVQIDTGSTDNLSDYLVHKLLDRYFRNQAYSAPEIFVALSTTTPTDSAAGTEPGSNYARVNFGDWTNSSGGALSNNTAITFTTATGDWGTITYGQLFDAITSGNYLGYAQVTSQAVGNGDTVEYPAGDFDVSLT